ncbi:MAG: hypothetical protein ACRBEQ_14690 [Hyphomonas sp.]
MCWDFAGLGETEAERKLQEMASTIRFGLRDKRLMAHPVAKSVDLPD